MQSLAHSSRMCIQVTRARWQSLAMLFLIFIKSLSSPEEEFNFPVSRKGLKKGLNEIVYTILKMVPKYLTQYSLPNGHFYFLSYYLKLLVGMPFCLPCFISSVSLVVLTFIPLLQPLLSHPIPLLFLKSYCPTCSPPPFMYVWCVQPTKFIQAAQAWIGQLLSHGNIAEGNDSSSLVHQSLLLVPHEPSPICGEVLP